MMKAKEANSKTSLFALILIEPAHTGKTPHPLLHVQQRNLHEIQGVREPAAYPLKEREKLGRASKSWGTDVRIVPLVSFFFWFLT